MSILAFTLLGVFASYIIESEDNQKSIFYKNKVLITISLILIFLISTIFLLKSW